MSITVDPYSRAACKLGLRLGAETLASGSGFFCASGARHFLVTARHNLTGRHHFTKQCLSTQCGEPNRICVRPGGALHEDWFEIPIKDEDEGPLWAETGASDVAWLDVTGHVAPERVIGRFEPRPHLHPIVHSVGDTLFLLGYPCGVETGRLPVWKRASLGSEPSTDLVIDGLACGPLPALLVDTLSMKGMSGALALVKTNDPLIQHKDGSLGRYAWSRSFHYDLIGVYGGRVVPQQLGDAMLGIVWKLPPEFDQARG